MGFEFLDVTFGRVLHLLTFAISVVLTGTFILVIHREWRDFRIWTILVIAAAAIAYAGVALNGMWPVTTIATMFILASVVVSGLINIMGRASTEANPPC